jgi:hypothetical protein
MPRLTYCPREVRDSKLTPEGVRYFNDVDRNQVYQHMLAKARAQAAREPIRLEADELGSLPALLGGRAARPTQPVILYDAHGRVHVVSGKMPEAAELQEILQRKTEEPARPAPIQKETAATKLVVARLVGKTQRR